MLVRDKGHVSSRTSPVKNTNRFPGHQVNDRCNTRAALALSYFFLTKGTFELTHIHIFVQTNIHVNNDIISIWKAKIIFGINPDIVG